MKSRPSYDLLALRALLDGAPSRLAALTAHAAGRLPCPECGAEGPHEENHDGSTLLCGCGTQFDRPELEAP